MKFKAVLLLFLVLGACTTTKTVKETFVVDHRSPKIEIGVVEVQMDKVLAIAGIKKTELNVDYYPVEDAVCIRYKADFYDYNQFWSRSARAAFIEALEKYKVDYDEKTFGKSGKKSKSQYGKVYGYLIWQMFKYTVRASANMDIELGYYFKSKAPYFTTTQKEAEYHDPETMSREIRTSPEVMMYFTRAQADDLAALFDEKFLQTLSLPASGKAASPASTADKDEY